jgi:hypothetical protein
MVSTKLLRLLTFEPDHLTFSREATVLKYPNTRENLTGKGHFLGAPIN